MSQHPLFHQSAALQPLLRIPPYVLGRPLAPINAWLGTRGTVTSLHCDPADNLLLQLAGHKYVRLYAQCETPRLYARTIRARGSNVFGTSPVRVESPDLERYPGFAAAAYSEALLEPGDMLFIPKHAWHYVRALSTSVSVNIWF